MLRPFLSNEAAEMLKKSAKNVHPPRASNARPPLVRPPPGHGGGGIKTGLPRIKAHPSADRPEMPSDKANLPRIKVTLIRIKPRLP